MTPSFRGIAARTLAEKVRESFFAEFLREISRRKKMVCTNLREISRSFLRESSGLRNFVRGVNAKKELFSWADLYICFHTTRCVRILPSNGTGLFAPKYLVPEHLVRDDSSHFFVLVITYHFSGLLVSFYINGI